MPIGCTHLGLNPPDIAILTRIEHFLRNLEVACVVRYNMPRLNLNSTLRFRVILNLPTATLLASALSPQL